MNVKVTTDKACIFGVSGASAVVGGAQVAKGGGEIASGVASAPETAGTSIVITAKGGIELKKGVEKLDRAWDFGKKAAHSYEQYRLDKETFEDIEGAGNSTISKNKIKHITNRHSFNKFKDEIPNLLKKYTREQVEELISKRSFFDKSWTDDKIAKVAQEVYSKYASLGETGNIPIKKIYWICEN